MQPLGDTTLSCLGFLLAHTTKPCIQCSGGDFLKSPGEAFSLKQDPWKHCTCRVNYFMKVSGADRSYFESRLAWLMSRRLLTKSSSSIFTDVLEETRLGAGLPGGKEGAGLEATLLGMAGKEGAGLEATLLGMACREGRGVVAGLAVVAPRNAACAANWALSFSFSARTFRTKAASSSCSFRGIDY